MQKKAGIEKKPDEKEHKEQMADTNAYLSIIPLIINELNMPIKRCGVAEWNKEQKLSVCREKWTGTCKIIKLDHCLTPSIEISLK